MTDSDAQDRTGAATGVQDAQDAQERPATPVDVRGLAAADLLPDDGLAVGDLTGLEGAVLVDWEPEAFAAAKLALAHARPVIRRLEHARPDHVPDYAEPERLERLERRIRRTVGPSIVLSAVEMETLEAAAAALSCDATHSPPDDWVLVEERITAAQLALYRERHGLGLPAGVTEVGP